MKNKGEKTCGQAHIGLRKVFRPAAVPRLANQLITLKLMLDLFKSVVIVIQTVKRKSALFLVSAVFTKQKTIIIIILYTVLVNNLSYSVIKAEVNC
jgi:hypothetical protein